MGRVVFDSLPLFPGAGTAARPPAETPASPPAEEPAKRLATPPVRASAKARVLAGLIDLGVVAAGLALALAGLGAMDISPGIADLAPLALFVLAFSFLYEVLPLAFWGSTAGMAKLGLIARARGERPITFAQAGRRWLGGACIVLTCGLAMLTVVRGRWLVDALSNTVTLKT